MAENIDSVGEILEFAIDREVEAHNLYNYMAAHVADPEMRQVCEDFAKEELEHRAKLELIKTGEAVTDFDISDYTPELRQDMDMDYEDLLTFAVKKEDKSVKLYSDLAEVVKEGKTRKLLLLLAEEETMHKQRFEDEYNKVTQER